MSMLVIGHIYYFTFLAVIVYNSVEIKEKMSKIGICFQKEILLKHEQIK